MSSSSTAFAAGAVAGAVDTCLTMPLDTIKTQMQLKTYSSPFGCGRAIVAADGVKGLYYGFRPFLLQASGKAAVRFFMYENICRAVDAEDRNDTCGAPCFSSILSTAWVVINTLTSAGCARTITEAPRARIAHFLCLATTHITTAAAAFAA